MTHPTIQWLAMSSAFWLKITTKILAQGNNMSELYMHVCLSCRLDLLSCTLLIVLYTVIFLAGVLGNLAIVSAICTNKVR